MPIEEEPTEPEVETPKSLPYGLSVDLQEVDILQMVMFKLSDSVSNDEGNFFSFLKYKAMDSLIWNVEGATNKKQLIKRDENSFGVSTEWGHNFYTPGKHMTYLKGYIDGVQVVSDSVLVDVLPSKKDFLNLNWSDVPLPGNASTGYANNDVEDYTFSIYPRLTDGIKSASLYAFHTTVSRNENSFGQLSDRVKKVLTEYIDTIFGEATYTIEGDSGLDRHYAEHFKRKQSDVSVIRIWKTPKTNIALLQEIGDNSRDEEYFIYAEPNNQ